jgi:hypothetical protein
LHLKSGLDGLRGEGNQSWGWLVMRGKLEWCLVWQLNRGIDRANGRHWVDECGAWRGGANSELSLLVVEVCKVEMVSVSVAQDSGCMIQASGPSRCRTGGSRCEGLHADLMLSLWTLDQTSVLVLS